MKLATLALKMSSLLEWVHGEICSEMGRDTPTAYAEYLLDIGSLKEVKEYMKQLYGPGYEGKVEKFVKNYQIRMRQQDENMTVYRKGILLEISPTETTKMARIGDKIVL